MTKTETQLKVICTTNSLAADTTRFASVVLRDVNSTWTCRHNGGKVVIMCGRTDSLADVEAALDESLLVTSYEEMAS